MSESAALNKTRIAARIALAGLLGGWLAGCSSDSTRLSESPFDNPFSSVSNDQGAPLPHANLSSNAPAQPSVNYAAAAHPSPVAVSALPPPGPATTGAIGKPTTSQPITGFGNGWRAAGGSSVMVADGDNLDSLSRRYGVPPSALMKANGFTSPSQVHGGVRLIVPVYDASGKAASADAVEAPAPKASAKTKAHDKDVAAKEAKLDAAHLKARPISRTRQSTGRSIPRRPRTPMRPSPRPPPKPPSPKRRSSRPMSPKPISPRRPPRKPRRSLSTPRRPAPSTPSRPRLRQL
jgi:LysM repeat protein